MTRRLPSPQTQRTRGRATRPDPLADAVRAIAGQARADGLPVDAADARGLAQVMQHLGFDAPGLAAAGPVIARLVAEILALDGAVATTTSPAPPTPIERPTR